MSMSRPMQDDTRVVNSLEVSPCGHHHVVDCQVVAAEGVEDLLHIKAGDQDHGELLVLLQDLLFSVAHDCTTLVGLPHIIHLVNDSHPPRVFSFFFLALASPQILLCFWQSSLMSLWLVLEILAKRASRLIHFSTLQCIGSFNEHNKIGSSSNTYRVSLFLFMVPLSNI